jgi:PAS domain S-box-containing protein
MLREMRESVNHIAKNEMIDPKEDRLDQMYSRLFKNLPGFAYKCKYDKNWTMLFMSEGCYNVTGYHSEEIIGNKEISYSDIIYRKDRKSVKLAVENAYKKNTHFEMEYRIVKRSGEMRWVWERGFCIIDDDNKLIAIEGYITDITDRKIIEAEKLETQMMYQDLVELSPDGIIILTLKGIIKNVNKAFCDMAGYPASEFINKTINNIPTIIKGNIAQYLKLFNSIIFSKSDESVYFKFLNREGDKRLCEGRVRLIKIKGDNYVLGVIRDITDQDRARSELIRSKIKAETLLNASPDLMFVFDKHGTIIDYKSDPDELYYRKDDLIAKNIYDILPDDIAKMTKDYTNKTLASHQLQLYEYSLELPEKGVFHYEARMVESSKDEVTVIIRDITDQKAMENNLIEAKEKAEESNRLKTAFLANMSHEIRTPMNAIVGFSNLLQRSRTDEETKKYVELIKTSSDYLMGLINDVLFYSRLQSETIPVYSSSIELKSFFHKLYDTFDLVDRKKDIRLRVNLQKDTIDLNVISDYEKLWEIMTVLISNAIKYTDHGDIEFGAIKLTDKLRFYVEDSGIGIPQKDIDKIFERFYRAENVVTSPYGGTGLGLSIALELVEILKGTIGVTSVEGKGSNFYFDIPFVEALSPEKKTRSKRLLNPKLKDYIVLIVEDNEPNYIYLRELMKDCVAGIDYASNGKQAIDLVEKNHYDLILMDVKMPIMGGIEATKIIKKKYPQIPIILQTAYSQPEEKEDADHAGADAHLSKPINQSDLEKVIERVCQVEICH